MIPVSFKKENMEKIDFYAAFKKYFPTGYVGSQVIFKLWIPAEFYCYMDTKRDFSIDPFVDPESLLDNLKQTAIVFEREIPFAVVHYNEVGIIPSLPIPFDRKGQCVIHWSKVSECVFHPKKPIYQEPKIIS